MAKRTPKPADLNRRAASVVAQAVGDGPAEKSAGAVESGREGGKSRAARLTPKERSESARRAAAARWGKNG